MGVGYTLFMGFLYRSIAALGRMFFLPVLFVALVGVVLQGLTAGCAIFIGDDRPDLLVRRVASLFGVAPLTLRLVAYGLPQASLLAFVTVRSRSLRHRLRNVRSRSTLRIPRIAAVLRGFGVMLTTLVLGLLLLQPTLVSIYRFDQTSWWERTANLLDGRSATYAWQAGSAVWGRLRGRPWAKTMPGGKDGGKMGSRMSRWDPLLTAATRDRHHFAQTKAFMWVESAGRQFAVSQTGCAGLMQFCVTTAQRAPFKSIFGAGNITACDCGGKPCSIPKRIRRELETDPDAVRRHASTFPCSLSDARFDGDRAIRAGAAYTTELSEDVGDNLYLMYIGYNSGPAVAKRLHKIVGSDATLDEIRPHLATVLSRWYGSRASARANGLLDVHLPKLMGAYKSYR